jgi:hypothetical protein
MKRRLSVALRALLVVGTLGAARGALAQSTGADAPRPPPARTDSAGARLDRPVRVRASHRVDVIAPGERVETIIDRMRSSARPVTPPADVKPVERPPPPRAADRGHEREREDSRSDPQHGSGGGPHAAPAGSGAERTHR